MPDYVLRTDALKVGFPGGLQAIRGVSLELAKAEILAVVGESGAGKTLLARVLYGLDPYIPGIKVEGRREVLTKAAMIFQDPGQFLNPGIDIFSHFQAFLDRNKFPDRAARRARAAELLRYVGLEEEQGILSRKIGELSGGQQQRVMVALALSQNPGILFADEAMASLDTVNKKKTGELLLRLRDELGLSILFITHDLPLADRLCDRILVLYAGRVLEIGSSESVFCAAKHPYTRALVSAQPGTETRGRKLNEIPGQMPGPDWASPGCPFAERCPHVREVCTRELPPLEAAEDGSFFACHGRSLVHPEGGWIK